MRKPTVVTIGNFDGVHLGHRRLLDRARELAGSDGRVVAMFFDPHPAQVLRPDRMPQRLTTSDRRRSLIETAGADEVVILEPSQSLLGLSPVNFLEDVVMPLGPTTIVEGRDFRFGKDRTGSIETLAQLGEAMGFTVDIIDAVTVELSDQSLVRASSSIVRWLVARGRVGDASRVLGRRYSLGGSVVSGAKRGRLLGIPTANMKSSLMAPGPGVYAGQATDPKGSWHPAAINVGSGPTFGVGPSRVEVHLIGYDGPLDSYDWSMEVEFETFLRDEICFDGPQAVSEQIRRDIRRASQFGCDMARAI